MKNRFLYLGIFLSILPGCAVRANEQGLPAVHSGDFIVRPLPTERSGMAIYGEVYIPVTSGEKVPLVIMSHGFNSTYRSNETYAQALARAGIASYVFDFCGGSTRSRSEGTMQDMSVKTEAEDLNAVIDLLRALDFVDARNIFLMGRSQGGYVSSLVAAQRPEDIRGLILFYPAFIIQTTAWEHYASTGESLKSGTVLGVSVGRQYFADALDLDIYQTIQGYTGDVLIIHGDRDSLVPLSYSQEAVKVYTSAELIVIQGAGHGFYGEHAEHALREVCAYIEEHRI